MLKKRIFNCTKPLKVLPVYPLEEPFLPLRNLKKVSYENTDPLELHIKTLDGFAINPMKLWFCTKPLRVSYEALKDPYFHTKPFFKFHSEKKGFSVKGSSLVFAGRTFKGSVELKNRFLSI